MPVQNKPPNDEEPAHERRIFFSEGAARSCSTRRSAVLMVENQEGCRTPNPARRWQAREAGVRQRQNRQRGDARRPPAVLRVAAQRAEPGEVACAPSREPRQRPVQQTVVASGIVRTAAATSRLLRQRTASVFTAPQPARCAHARQFVACCSGRYARAEERGGSVEARSWKR